MSTELIAAWFWTTSNTLDPVAAKHAVDEATREELDAYWQQVSGESPSDDDFAEGSVTAQAYDEIDTVVSLPESRGGLVIEAPGGDRFLWFAGGSSAGDDPNDEFTAVSNLLAFPSVMRALGMTR